MDDRLREFGEVPGYEFDAPRDPWPPRPGIGGAQWRGQARPQPPSGERTWPPRRPSQPSAGADQAPRPGRPALLARDTLAAMRARNWLTTLAAPLVAAIAVGVAAVVVLSLIHI